MTQTTLTADRLKPGDTLHFPQVVTDDPIPCGDCALDQITVKAGNALLSLRNKHGEGFDVCLPITDHLAVTR